MNKAKKNNKGFSLVELIVVVLIMAIIAVSLAPQVMKWVNNSRIATDVSTYDSLVANCQLALTDSAAYSEVTTAAAATVYTIKFDDNGLTINDKAITDASVKDTAFVKAMNALDASWGSLEAKVTFGDAEAPYDIQITKSGTVVRGKAPDGSTVK